LDLFVSPSPGSRKGPGVACMMYEVSARLTGRIPPENGGPDGRLRCDQEGMQELPCILFHSARCKADGRLFGRPFVSPPSSSRRPK
jgi:hypothetical protein